MRLVALAFLLSGLITTRTSAAPGDLDMTFGKGGKVTSAGFYGNAVAVQPDGRIVAAGNGLERYNTDGSPDASFGTNGRADLPGTVFPAPAGCGGYFPSDCYFIPNSAAAVAIQADGKIIAAGNGQIYDDEGFYDVWVFALWRYNADGSLDASFGSGGKVVTYGFAGEGGPRAVTVQSDGKIVVAGYKRDNSWDFLTVRYNTNGTLDNSFGTGGKVETSLADNLFGADAVVIQSDGKIIAAGNGSDGTSQGFALTRYQTDGSLDISFGTGGKVVTPFDNRSYAYAVAVQSDGKIIAAGSTDSGIALARYNTNSSLDTTFGTSGKVVTTFPDGEGAKSVAIQSDGKIVVLASNRFTFNTPVYALFRYQARAESSFTVTRSDDRNNAACVPGDCSLREAVNAANASGSDDTINFAAGLTTVTLTNQIVINNNTGALNINGTGANNLTIDGGTGANQIFVSFGAVTISGVTLTGGNGGGGGITIGGAIYAEGSLTLDSVHITGNSVNRACGGVYFVGGTHRILNSTFSNNFGGDCGGGFYNNGGTMTVINSTISNNTAAQEGGGFCGNDGNTTLRNVTITNNVGGGIAQDEGTLDLGNTIVAGNIVNSGREINALIISAGGNLFGASAGASPVTGINYQPTDIRDINPVLGALTNNGGSTPTHALLSGSPLIDNGINILVSPFALAFDQRGTGFARVRDGNGDGIATVDIGAFEVQTGSGINRKTPFDFDGDGKADVSVFRSTDRVWYLLRSSSGYTAQQFGNSTDKIVPADFDGDGKTDIAVFRNGFWYWLNSSNGSFQSVQFGQAGDIPVPADYTGDGRSELAVYRLGFWYMLNLVNNQFQAAQFGNATDKPVPADYDADGKTDFAVYRDGTWYLQRSSQDFAAVQFGNATDKPTVGDYDGDSKADQAVYRNGTWYVLGSMQGYFAVQFGISGDTPTPADYDGDGKTDVAVFRDGTWYLQRSQQGFAAVQFGATNDKPIPAAFVP